MPKIHGDQFIKDYSARRVPTNVASDHTQSLTTGTKFSCNIQSLGMKMEAKINADFNRREIFSQLFNFQLIKTYYNKISIKL